MKLLRLASIFFLGFSIAWGGGRGGSEVGNGANVVVLPDDRIVVEDAYKGTPENTESNSYLDFHPLIQAEIERMGLFLVRMGGAVDDSAPRPLPPEVAASLVKSRYLSRTAESKFVLQSIKHPLIEYRFVDALPVNCHAVPEDAPVLPAGSTLVPAACTEGPVTWISKVLFPRMSVRQQARLIFHERMHSLVQDFPHDFIADITNGLDLMLSTFNLQIAGSRPALDMSQVTLLNLLIKRIVQTGLSVGRPEEDMEFIQHWRILPNGGGLAHRNSTVSPYAYLGVGSILGDGSILEDNSEMIGSSCYLAACVLQEGSSMLDSAVAPSPTNRINPNDDFAATGFFLRLGKNAQIQYSQLTATPSIGVAPRNAYILGEKSKILNSSVSGLESLILDDLADIDHFALAASTRAKAVPRVHLQTGAGLMNGFTFLVLQGNELVAREISVSIPEKTLLDFEQSPICPATQYLFAKESLTVGSKDVMKGLCRSGF